MNDFTKEELNYLYELIGFFSIEGYEKVHCETENKIQSMIDNYCEIKTPTLDDYE